MIEIDRTEGYVLTPFLKHTEETMLYSYTQGHLGRGWVDQRESPSCARIVVGDFCYLAGDAGGKMAQQICSDIPFTTSEGGLIVCEHEGWESLVEETYGAECEKITRYAFRKDTAFNRHKLEHYVGQLPAAYEMKRIDAELYQQCLQDPVMADLVSVFESEEQYLEYGIGYCITKEKEIICGASSYTYYDDGIEIEIDTKELYRKQGLATICASRLILQCLEEGKYPSWDAANLKSVGLAKKLGYELDHAYIAYIKEDGRNRE